MKLDPALLRDILKVDKDGEMPVTAEQWLRFPVAATPTKEQIQKAYQEQVERLKRVRGDFDLAQLRYASQQIRQAAIELNADLSSDSPLGAASTVPAAKPPVAPPLPSDSAQQPVMAKPIQAAPVAAAAAAGPGVEIDTNKTVSKKKRGNILFTWLFLSGIFAGTVTILFVLTQLQIINLYQMAAQNNPPASPDSTADPNSPQSSVGQPTDAGSNSKSANSGRNNTRSNAGNNTGQPGAGKPGSAQSNLTTTAGNRNGRRQNTASRKPANTNSGSSTRPAVNPDKRNATIVTQISGNPRTGQNTSNQQTKPVVNDPAKIRQPDGDAQEELPASDVDELPENWTLRYSDYSIEQWYKSINQFDTGLAAIAVGSDPQILDRISSLRTEKAFANRQLASFLLDVHHAHHSFDLMLKSRLPLIEATGEFTVAGDPVSVISCRPGNYIFRIGGVNRRFNDSDLPLGLQLAMFNGVVPDVPFDDVCIHVFKCLPYLRGDADLRASLLKRLDTTATMEVGTIFQRDTVQRLKSFLTAGGSMSRWLAAAGGTEMKKDRRKIGALVRQKPSQRLNWYSLPNELLDMMYENALRVDSAYFYQIRSQTIAEALKVGKISLAAELINESLVWADTSAEDIEMTMLQALLEPGQGAEQSTEWLNSIEQQLTMPGNDPVLSEALVGLGEKIAERFQRREARRWKTKLIRARKAGETVTVPSFPEK